MSGTGTQTRTFTVVDIRRVVENFAADFFMMAQATGLWSRESIVETVSDLIVFAEHSLLVSVKLILKDGEGRKIRGAVYNVSESAIGWVSERPGNNLWPKTPNGSLSVVAVLSDVWWKKTDSEKQAFVKNLYGEWPRTSEDTSFFGMNSSSGQRYASNGYGWQRTNYN